MAMQQEIKYCTTPDGVRLAYATMGTGSPIVRTSHWFTHLDYDLKSSVLRHMVLGLAHNRRLLRYDGRGNGLSQRDVTDISFQRWVSDLEVVIDAAGFDRFVLVGISQGASIAIAYAARHPERVSHLIIYCGFARGLLHRGGDPEKQKQSLELARALVREGWGSEAESHRQFFTSQFIPDGTAEQQHSLNELERVSAAPEMAERSIIELANVNVVDLLPKVKAPTLVLHVRGDLRVPFALGQEIAAGIPGAKFVPLEGRNHLFLPNEPAHREFHDALAAFLGDKPTRGPLPGTAGFRQRFESAIGQVERNWFIKLVIIFAALTGVAIFFLEIWRLLQH
jgi:pimeloyl-ACP methyl ester carboxylesterase